MRSTLFFIPHEILGVPLLGIGWLLFALVIAFIAWCVWHAKRGELSNELTSGLPVWAIAAALIILVLPQIETRWPGGEPIGLPVRGYGVMVLLGLFSGIGITVWRGSQMNIAADTIVSLGFWMMLGGVIGARIFFTVQYWDEFAQIPSPQRWIAILKLTEGGLVIYGGMVGGVVAGALYCFLYKQPMLAFADLITPGFLIGLAFGRIGCLLNGCCFGGVCTADLPAVRFPQGSPPYQSQLENGSVLGMTTQRSSTRENKILKVAPGSIAELKLHAQPGQEFEEVHQSIPPDPKVDDPAGTPRLAASVSIGNDRYSLAPEELPPWSLPVHPSQIYSAIDAALLCLLILAIQPCVWRDGQAFYIAVMLHGVARFTLELIRSDEAGQFGTSLTIAQWISIVGFIAAALALVVTSRMQSYRAWAWPAA